MTLGRVLLHVRGSRITGLPSLVILLPRSAPSFHSSMTANTVPLSPTATNISLLSHPSLLMRPQSPSNETSQLQKFASSPDLATVTSSVATPTASLTSNAAESHAGGKADSYETLDVLAVDQYSFTLKTC